MKNLKQIGGVLTLTAPYTVLSGAGVLVGSIFGIAQTDAASGASVSIVRSGVFTHAKNSGEAWAVGEQVYWDDTAKVFTTDDTGNVLVGAAVAAAANPSASGTVLLDGVIR